MAGDSALAWIDSGALADVRGLFTSRQGGVSTAPWDDGSGGGGLNLATHVGDAADAVAANRARLAARCGGVAAVYLEQVHGCEVADLDRWDGVSVPRADAAVVTRRGLAACVLVADCLPVLLAAPGGVAAAHAGWKGLAAGVLEASVAALRAKTGCDAVAIQAWLGPAIGPRHFEVGAEVIEACAGSDPLALACCVPTAGGKWRLDLAALARLRLQRCGLRRIDGADLCTVSDPTWFWSYRRDRVCGRQAGLIWRMPGTGD